MRGIIGMSHSQLARISIWAFVFGVAFSTGAQGQIPLGEFPTSWGVYTGTLYNPGRYYYAEILVDMDHDGVMEVLAGDRGPDVVDIWDYNQWTGHLEVVDTIRGFPYDIHDVAAGDFDHDGDVDVAVGIRGYGCYVAINGAPPGSWWGGTWNVRFVHGHYAWQTMVADFDDDGNLDIFHGTDWAYIKILYGDGSGGFTLGPSPPRVPGSNYNAARGFTAVDLNGDLRIDLIGLPSERFPPNPVQNFLRAHLNTGSPGTISWSKTVGPLYPLPAYSNDVSNSAADFDGNGYIDRLVVVGEPKIRVGIFWGGADELGLNWTLDDTVGVIPAPGTLVAGDVDDDGESDIIARGGVFDGLYIFVGDGTGNFTDGEPIPIPYLLGGGRNSVNTGDINGDGWTDIVTGRRPGPGYAYGLVVLTKTPLNEPPVANAGPDQIVEQESYVGTEVTLDGSGSTDPDSTEGTNDDIVAFEWFEGETFLGSGEIITHTFPLGSNTVTLVVVDSFGETDEDDVIIVVQDTTPPTINSVSASPDTLWPPNHKMVEVTVTVDAEDICDPAPFCKIVDVTSNEPINGPGDGNTEPDWEITGELTVMLRAERAGGGTGRVYTIHIDCTDASDNTTITMVDVIVPHDKGKGKK